ncbi:hypothetical protein [Ideonella alba]|uniref:Uncharacterized protein n=1 Tax=Ideonella alba TaxID=2824118 RepID=A0A940YDL3_9BURK|nr:hypothetical protein [Ideonella alba]MBQ0933673.1 hypothetical protein [Ideonella alba]
MTHHTGTAGTSEDGTYFTQVTGAFLVDQSNVELTWTLRKTPDGTLTTLSIAASDAAGDSRAWQTAAYEFATSVLAATLADKRVKFFRRSLFFYLGPQLDGEYWLPGFRFAPAFPEDDQPHLINAERVVSIDQEILAIDDMQAYALAEESSRRHAARLSLLLNVGLYRAEHSMRWVLPTTQGVPATESIRYHLAFSRPEAALTAMPEKGARCPLGAYTGSLAARYRVAGELQSLPREARKILRGVDRAAPGVADAFDRGARLYQVASVCGQQFPSVGLAYRVAAVEAMSAADPSCKGFSEFMRKYVTSLKDIDSLLDYLYGQARSGHFHAGSFPGGEFSRVNYFDPLMDMEKVERDSIHRTCYELTREAIVNWMQSVVPPEVDSA